MREFTNQSVSEHLQNIATAYEIKHKSRFRIVAYENAADVAVSYPESIYQIWLKDPKLLDSIPNFGPAICAKVAHLFKTGHPHPTVAKIFQTLHPAVFTFTKINGIGPKTAALLTENLKFSHKPIEALEQLVDYAQAHRLHNLPRFGEKSETLILDNTLAYLGRKNRMMYADAQKLADKIIDYLHQKFPDTKFIPLGSLRRRSPTVGDIDIAAASDDPVSIINYFIEYPRAVQVLANGDNKASIRLLHDVRIDLMIKPPRSFGSLLQHFTGSRQHNILLRRHALSLGYSLSEYGIKDLKSGQILEFDTEEKFYKFLGFKYIPPEDRVGEDELEKYKML